MHQLLSLDDLYDGRLFRIPDYQRGYSWEQKHLKDFWNDIEQLPDGKNHYTGVLTFEPVGRDLYERWDDDLWIIQAKRYAPLYVGYGFENRFKENYCRSQSLLSIHDIEGFKPPCLDKPKVIIPQFPFFRWDFFKRNDARIVLLSIFKCG